MYTPIIDNIHLVPKCFLTYSSLLPKTPTCAQCIFQGHLHISIPRCPASICVFASNSSTLLGLLLCQYSVRTKPNQTSLRSRHSALVGKSRHALTRDNTWQRFFEQQCPQMDPLQSTSAPQAQVLVFLTFAHTSENR